MATEKKKTVKTDQLQQVLIVLQHMVEFGLVQISLRSVRVSRTETEHSHAEMLRNKRFCHSLIKRIHQDLYL